MFNYRLTDINGRVIGMISLETEDLPKNIINGVNYLLSCSYVKPPEAETVLGRIKQRQNPGEGAKVLSFHVHPQPIEEARPVMPYRRYRRQITKRIDRVE